MLNYFGGILAKCVSSYNARKTEGFSWRDCYIMNIDYAYI